MRNPFHLISCVAIALLTISAAAQQRPPAVPLIVHNPYFSVWSAADKLTDKNTTHWTGTDQPITGLARIDGKLWRFMGAEPDSVPPMEQTALTVTPTRTIYVFKADGIKLVVDFLTPALPNDLDVLSRPVTYLNFTASNDGSTAPSSNTHDVSLLIDVDPVIAVDRADQPVTWGRTRAGSLDVLSVGSRDQQVLNRSGDNLRIDWGYFHLAVPRTAGAETALSADAVSEFRRTGKLPDADEISMPKSPTSSAAHLAVLLPLGQLANTPIERHLLFSYTEEYAIEYFGRKLRPYWQRDNLSVSKMLDLAEQQRSSLITRAANFDAELTTDLEHAGGNDYAQLAILAYRQTLAAHALVADLDGAPMLFPKENFSNGCIATVDVLYPSFPFFLVLNPALAEAQMKPVLEYAALPRWKWPFAPHDLGTYPLANGQVYGGGERTEEDQMPVEESGNLLIMAAALGRAEGNYNFAQKYWKQFSQWAAYLRDKGLDPENQLSTDDFAGHLAHNANLSIKAIEGLAAYAEIARALNKPEIAAEYDKLAHQMASQWPAMALDDDHYKLAFDKPGSQAESWSQKYNLVWDKIMDWNLFPAAIRDKELAFYLQRQNKFGLPLDNRATYTKLDWTVWTATLADNQQDFLRILAPLGQWINQGPTRTPMTDWFDTKDGHEIGFQARSVVGGIYIKVLADHTLAEKWQKHVE